MGISAAALDRSVGEAPKSETAGVSVLLRILQYCACARPHPLVTRTHCSNRTKILSIKNEKVARFMKFVAELQSLPESVQWQH